MFWRVKITFASEKPVLLPVNYSNLLQSYIYNTFTVELAEFLHNKGFKNQGKVFKLFTFSKLFGKYKVYQKTISFSSPFYFYFSTPLDIIIDSFSSEILKKIEGKIGNNVVFTESIEFEEIKLSNEMAVKTLSPITVHLSEITPDKKVILRYLSPEEENFFKLLKDNLLKKSLVVLGDYGSNDIELIPISRKWKKVVTFFKKTPIVGWEGTLLLRGDERIIGIGLTAGLGSKSSQGFGMVAEYMNKT